MSPYALAIRHTPVILERIVDEVPMERFSEKLSSDRFTLTEMVAHLADFEETVLDRLVIASEKPGSVVENFDEEARSIEKNYAAKSIRHEIDTFATRRRETILYIETLSEEKWSNTIIHPSLGTLSIADLLCTLHGHDLYHIEQASAYMTELHELVP
jgi:uncharacterized damage-inducible protein DinB